MVKSSQRLRAVTKAALDGAGFLHVDEVETRDEMRICGAHLYTIFLQDGVAE